MKYSRDRTDNSSDSAKRTMKIIVKFLLIIFSILILKSLLSFGNLNKSADLIDQEDPYPQWVAEQLALINVNITLGEWKKIRPAETILLFNHSDAKAGPPIYRNSCARAEARLDLGDGTEAIRYAFFYPPEPPENLELPGEKEAAFMLDRYCTLGLIWTQRRENLTERGKELACSVRASIDRRFGKGQADIRMQFWGAGSWSETGRWQTGASTLVSAYADWKYHPSRSKVLLAFAFLPISQLWVDFGFPKRTYVYDESEFPGVRAKKMISESKILDPEKNLMLDVIVDIEAFQQEKYQGTWEPFVRQFVKAIQRWMATAQKLDARHKAAALLAADEVLFMGKYPFISAPEAGKQARQELSKLGAEFNYDGIGKYFVYTRTWLKQAHEIDPEGPAGELAFRILMEMGFDTSGTCSGGREQFRKVIEQGELYLKKKHDLESTVAVERMVANAYRDIVFIANGAEFFAQIDDYKLNPKAAIGARIKAIQYYRKALPKAKYTYETTIAWTEAWRMIAGLPPVQVRYFCLND